MYLCSAYFSTLFVGWNLKTDSLQLEGNVIDSKPRVRITNLLASCSFAARQKTISADDCVVFAEMVYFSERNLDTDLKHNILIQLVLRLLKSSASSNEHFKSAQHEIIFLCGGYVIFRIRS